MKCLLPSEIEKIKQDFKDKNEKFIPSDYMKLDGDKITEKLKPIIGDKAAAFSDLIQSKLILKNRIRGLEILRDKINEKGKYSPNRVASANDEIARYKQQNLERVMSPKEHESFLSSLAAKIVGTELTRDQSKTVFDKSKNIEELKIKSKDKIFGTSVELSKAQHDLSNYINSLNEKPAWKSILDSAASLYKNLFIGVKTGVKTATLGTLNSGIEFINRRMTGTVLSNVDLGLRKDAAVENLKFFTKTGDNNFLKTSLDDNSIFGTSKGRFSEKFGSKDTIAEGKLKPIAKAVNVAARGVKFIAIDVLHKIPILANISANFVDASSITSTELAKMPLAKSLNMDANAIFKDSLKIEPQTDLGRIARERSQQEAFRILNINNTVLSDAAVELQKTINKSISIDGQSLHFGDYLLPMAKVPSNIIYNLLENFGVGIGTGLKDVIKGGNDLRNLGEKERADTLDGVKALNQMRDGVRTLTRTIGVIATAALIVQNLTKKDFKAPNQYGNSYVKIGGLWLNTVAFGGAGTAVTGAMLAKTGHSGMFTDYSKAGFSSAQQAPVIGDIVSIAQKGSKSGATGVASGIISSFWKPVMANDIQRSIQEKTMNPFFVGTLIRTEKQMKQEEDAAQKKLVQQRIQNTKNKSKKQTIF